MENDKRALHTTTGENYALTIEAGATTSTESCCSWCKFWEPNFENVPINAEDSDDPELCRNPTGPYVGGWMFPEDACASFADVSTVVLIAR